MVYINSLSNLLIFLIYIINKNKNSRNNEKNAKQNKTKKKIHWLFSILDKKKMSKTLNTQENYFKTCFAVLRRVSPYNM